MRKLWHEKMIEYTELRRYRPTALWLTHTLTGRSTHWLLHPHPNTHPHSTHSHSTHSTHTHTRTPTPTRTSTRVSDLHSSEASGLLGLALLGLAGGGGLVVDRVADGVLLRVSPAFQLLREP